MPMSIVEMTVIVLIITVGIQVICISLFSKKLRKIDDMLQDLQIDVQAYEKLKAQAVKTKQKKNVNKVGSWKK